MSNNFNLKNYIELLNKQNPTETDQLQLLSYGALVEDRFIITGKRSTSH